RGNLTRRAQSKRPNEQFKSFTHHWVRTSSKRMLSFASLAVSMQSRRTLTLTLSLFRMCLAPRRSAELYSAVSLLYRRVALCEPWQRPTRWHDPTPCRIQFGDTAD